MLKEIYDKLSVTKDTTEELHAKELFKMSGVEDNLEKFLNAERIIM
jgi:glucosamine--fructose-6-phosphate aminotransferase (isomerizing)